MEISAQDIADLLALLPSKVWGLLNSNFITALAGAFAGAGGATWFAFRTERKKRLLEEIRNTNAAIMTAFSITNTFCNLKKQHIKKLKEKYDHERSRFDKLDERRRNGEEIEPKEREINFDLQTLSPVQLPINTLKTILFEKVTLAGRPLSMVSTLSQSIEGYNSAVNQRNLIITALKKNPLPTDVMVHFYFGLEIERDRTDSSYPDLVGSLFSRTDDCISFSKIIGDDLTNHGQELAVSYGKNSPTINKLDFSIAEKDGLMPDPKKYDEWMNLAASSSIKY